ncbi:unnamed protein product [Rotaria magnacalcarata]
MKFHSHDSFFIQTLTHLGLNENKITDNGAQQLAEALKTNKTLTHLYLHQNQIKDAGAQSLGEALKTNQTLKVLYIGGNKFSSAVHTRLNQQNSRIQ